MTANLATSLRFVDGTQNMKRQGKTGVSVINDANNNETVLGDDQTITEKDINSYLQHYNKWKQSAWGHRLTAILREYFGYEFDAEIKWNNVLSIGLIHVIAICSFMRLVWRATIISYLWGFFVGGCAGFGLPEVFTGFGATKLTKPNYP